MTTTDELLELRQQIEKWKTKKASIRGALEQLHKQLKEEQGVTSLEEGKEKLDELTKQEALASKVLERKLKEFKEKYGKHFSE